MCYAEKYKKSTAKSKLDDNYKSAKKLFLRDKGKDTGRNTSCQKKDLEKSKSSNQKNIRNWP
jgi:hypothetical protein